MNSKFPDDKIIFNFKSPDAVDSQIVNDGVMGGISRSRFDITGHGTGIFRGELSLANNGGFASVRLRLPMRDLTGDRAFRLRIRGDGHDFKFIVRTDNVFDGVNYRSGFATKAGVWEELGLPFAQFEPTWRGRILTDMPALDPSRIETLGFLISDQQAGGFQLEVEWIKSTAW